MTRTRYLTVLSVALLASTAVPAFAEQAEVTADLNIRTGPSTRYQVITTVPDGGGVDVYGCVRGYDWCDVAWGAYRGWVFADYLDYTYRGSARAMSDWRDEIGVPLVSYDPDAYSERYYRDTPWYPGPYDVRDRPAAPPPDLESRLDGEMTDTETWDNELVHRRDSGDGSEQYEPPEPGFADRNTDDGYGGDDLHVGDKTDQVTGSDFPPEHVIAQ
ncbi:SH3 domain-containing protein [Microbaculum marinum]|uniref:SH3 domain-containing protein n=1 Tax=Microbaculum marinum TaxID=1764581 RepID=A0AAW9RHH9_9HYPH